MIVIQSRKIEFVFQSSCCTLLYFISSFYYYFSLVWKASRRLRGCQSVAEKVSELHTFPLLIALLLRYKNTVDPLFVLSFVTQEKYK